MDCISKAFALATFLANATVSAAGFCCARAAVPARTRASAAAMISFMGRSSSAHGAADETNGIDLRSETRPEGTLWWLLEHLRSRSIGDAVCCALPTGAPRPLEGLVLRHALRQ